MFLPYKVNDAIDFPETMWPRYLLHLCDWGCATTSCLDVTTGRIYLCRPSFKHGRYFALHQEASSLGAWFELWLAGDLKDKGQYIEDPTGPIEIPMERNMTHHARSKKIS